MALNVHAMFRDRIEKTKCINADRTPRKYNRGATAVEYAVMLALVAGVIFVAVGSLGGVVRSLFEAAAQGW